MNDNYRCGYDWFDYSQSIESNKIGHEIDNDHEYEPGHIVASESVRHNYKTHRSGNTFRIIGSKISRSAIFELETNHQSQSHFDDAGVIIPVTCVDTSYPSLLKNIELMCAPKRHGWRIIDSTSLDHKNMWEIQDILEERSINTSHSVHNSQGVLERKSTYQIPISGSVHVKIKDVSSFDKKMNTIKFYSNDYPTDPYVIYRISGKRLEVVISHIFPTMPTHITKIGFKITSSSQSQECDTKSAIIRNNREWDPSTKSLTKITDMKNHINPFRSWFYGTCENAYWQPPTSTKPNDHVILDMGKNMKVKYISTMGRPPKTRLYPLKGEDEHNSHLQKNPIRVFESQPKEFVTKYALYGRMESGSWVHVGNYAGNSDVVSEVVHNISNDMTDSFCPRYLKIVPLSHFGAKSMRFMLYGDIADVAPLIEESSQYITYTLLEMKNHFIVKEQSVMVADVIIVCSQNQFMHEQTPNNYVANLLIFITLIQTNLWNQGIRIILIYDLFKICLKCSLNFPVKEYDFHFVKDSFDFMIDIFKICTFSQGVLNFIQ